MCLDGLGTFGETILELNEISMKHNCNFNISTMTYTFSLDQNDIDLDEFSKRFEIDNVYIKPCKIRNKTKIKRNDFFFNQITIEYLTLSKKSIKIFKNGKIHVTGLSSMYDCEHVTDLVCQWLQMIFHKKYNPIDQSKKLVLLNCTLDFHRGFSIKEMINMLNANNVKYIGITIYFT